MLRSRFNPYFGVQFQYVLVTVAPNPNLWKLGPLFLPMNLNCTPYGPLSMLLSVQGDTVNCCDRLPIDDIIELDIRLGENDCIYIYIYIMSVTTSVRYTSWQKCWHAFILTYTLTCSPTDVLSLNLIYYIIKLYVILTITLTFFLTHILTFILTDFLMYCCCVCFFTVHDSADLPHTPKIQQVRMEKERNTAYI